MKAIYKKILDLYKTKNLFYTITSLSPELGEKCVLDSEQLEELNINIKAEKLPAIINKPRKSYFIENINDTPLLVLAGGGHVAVAIAKLAQFLEFNTVVIDDRAEFVTKERFPHSKRYAQDVGDTLQHDFGNNAYYVVVTRGHKDDFRAVSMVLSKKHYRYVGMIGSRQKVAITMKKLADQGYTQSTLSQIHAPIGLPIGAITPEEIAVSILAQIIKVKSSFVGDQSQHNVFEALAQIDEDAAIATIIEKHGSSPRGIGSKMLVTKSQKVFGTIGGGAVEYAAQKKAAEIATKKKAELVEYDLGLTDDTKLGMICGGRVKVLFEPIN